MITAGNKSATPILDLCAPLPKPQTPGFGPADHFVPILIVAAILATRNYRLLVPAFGFWVIILCGIAIHELGHVVAGCSLGFDFQSVAIGPIWIKHESSKWKITLRRSLLSGLTFMSLSRICKARKRLIIYIAAGPAAGLLLGLIALECLRISINRDEPFLSLILAGLAGSSILMNVGSLFPIRNGYYASDGTRLKVLLCSKEGTRRVLASYALEMQKRKGIDSLRLNSRWVGLASSRANVSASPAFLAYRDDWNEYQHAATTELAAQFLEGCLAKSAFLDEENRNGLILEAAVFTARARNDTGKAGIWFKRAVNPERIHPLIRLRAETTLSCASGRFDDSLRKLEKGLEVIRQAPATGTLVGQEAAWLKWRGEIETQRDQQSVDSRPSSTVII
jgi:Peptidase family M50